MRVRSAHGELDDLGDPGGDGDFGDPGCLTTSERLAVIILLAVNERGNRSVAIDFNKQPQKLLQWSTNHELGSLLMVSYYVTAGLQMAEAAPDFGCQLVIS